MRYEVDRKVHRLQVWDDNLLIAEFAVGVGADATPTMAGRWSVSIGSDDADVVATLNTPRLTCIRQTPAIESLGAAVSGG